jgi:flavin reductase (DIM6/NTAB) family NADH-FMN oxidoreductase RutF
MDHDITDQFRAAMRTCAATVMVVTTKLETQRFGMTATAVIPVSMEPPSILVSVNRGASLNEPLSSAGMFCVNILREGQVALAKAFSGALSGEARFSVGTWGNSNGIPFLVDAQSNLFCELERKISFGTHDLFLGTIQSVRQGDAPEPLVYSSGRFLSGISKLACQGQSPRQQAEGHR